MIRLPLWSLKRSSRSSASRGAEELARMARGQVRTPDDDPSGTRRRRGRRAPRAWPLLMLSLAMLGMVAASFPRSVESGRGAANHDLPRAGATNSPITVAPNSSGNVATFLLENTIDPTTTYTLGCTFTSPVTSCSVRSSITISAGGSATVSVTFSAGSSPSQGTVTLSISSGGAALSPAGVVPNLPPTTMYVNADVNLAQPPTVTGGSGTAMTGTSSNTAHFTVANPNGGSLTYSLSCGSAGRVSACSAPGSVTVAGSSSVGVDVTYSTGVFPGDGTVSLTATGAGGSATGSFNVTVEIPPAPPGVTGGSGTAPANTSENTAIFRVRNPNNDRLMNASLSCTAAGQVTGCTASGGVLLDYGMSVDVEVPYTTGAPGSGSVSLTATSEEGTGSGTYSVTVTSATANPPIVTSLGGDSASTNGSGSLSFAVRNPNDSAITYSFSCSYAAPVAGCTAPGSAQVGALATDTVSVGYTTGATTGTGSVTLTASGTGGSGSATAGVNVSAPPPPSGAPVVDVQSVNPGTRLDRSACVTVGAGAVGASQCGNLLITHSMPAYRTLDRDRTLTLLYNSATASLLPTIMADVQLPSDAAVPDSLRAVLAIGGQAFSYSLSSAGFTPGGPARRLAVSFDGAQAGLTTGVYAYALQVVSFHGATADSATAPGELLVVDRRASPYGAGWSIAGVEHLVPGQRDGAVLLVESDGSAAVYEATGANRWLAPAGAFRDTLTYGAVSDPDVPAGTYYLRRLLDGTKIYYDSAGLQKWVVDRFHRKVGYTYQNESDPASRLVSVRIAPYDAGKAYTLAYDAAGKLDYVLDPAGRKLDATVGSGLLMSLLDPGNILGEEEGFAYTGKLLTRRISPRGRWTRYGYFPASSLLAVDTLPQTRAGQGVSTFTPVQTRGRAYPGAAGQTATVLASAATFKFDGPRTVGDTTEFYLNRFGAPDSIRDALGFKTRLYRDSASMPLLVTRLTYANGRRVSMSYDRLARLVAAADLTNSAGADSTRYSYDPSFPDLLHMIIAPRDALHQDTTTYGYNADGTVDHVVDARDHKTGFSYNTRKQVSSVKEYAVPVFGQGTADSLVTQLVHDDAGSGNLLSATDPAGHTTSLFHDNYGNVRERVNGASDTVSWFYDAMNRPVSLIQFDGGLFPTTFFTYDAEGHLTRRTDPRQVSRQWAYDGMGRDTAMTDELGHVAYTFYDRAGNVTKTKDRMGDSITVKYDVLSRPCQKTLGRVRVDNTAEASLYTDTVFWPGAGKDAIPGIYADSNSVGTTISPGDVITYGYDAVGNLTSVDNVNSTVTRIYNPEGTLKSETQALKLSGAGTPVTLTYTYDRAGNRKTMRGLLGRTFTYTPGAGGLVDSITDGTRATTFGWDSLGRRTRVTLPDGTVTTYDYDATGQLARVYSLFGATTLLDLRYSAYDGAGRLLQVEDASDNPTSPTVSSWTYDHRGQTFTRDWRFRRGGADVGTYRYDAAGNLAVDRVSAQDSTTFTLVPLTNRVQKRLHRVPMTRDSSVYTYDYDGNTLREDVNNGSDQLRLPQDRYYDAAGQMVESTRTVADVTTHSGSKLRTFYFYDGLGRRVGTLGATTASHTPPAGSRIVDYYDGNDRVLHNGAIIAYGPGVDDPLWMQSNQIGVNCGYGESLEAYVTTGTGRLLQYHDGVTGSDCTQNGLPVWEGFGKYANVIEDSYGLGLQSVRDTSGVTYFRNRYYDAKLGRFTQEDPVGYAGGMNLYAYAGNNPATYTDPFGLCPIPADDCPAGTFTAVGTVLGAIAGGLGGGGFGLAGGPAAALTAAVGAAEGAAFGARVGAALDASLILMRGRLQPDPNATGPHSTFKRDPQTGKITKYDTFDRNPGSPDLWERIKSFQRSGQPHFDKATGRLIPTPHINEAGGARTPLPWEIPQ